MNEILDTRQITGINTRQYEIRRVKNGWTCTSKNMEVFTKDGRWIDRVANPGAINEEEICFSTINSIFDKLSFIDFITDFESRDPRDFTNETLPVEPGLQLSIPVEISTSQLFSQLQQRINKLEDMEHDLNCCRATLEVNVQPGRQLEFLAEHYSPAKSVHHNMIAIITALYKDLCRIRDES